MYHSAEFISELISLAGYNKDYEKIYVSSEYGVHKTSGELFIFLLTENNISPENLLHIGDNVNGDYESPKKMGINASLILSRYIQWKRTYGAAYGVEQPINIEEEMFFGAQASHLYDLPFPDGGIIDDKSKNKSFPMFRGNVSFLGFSLVGPLVYDVCCWINKAIEQRAPNKILFCARDGFVFYEAMKKLFPQYAEKFVYLHISRRTANMASLESVSDIKRLASLRFSPCTVSYLFNIRFGISAKNIFGADVSEKILNYEVDLNYVCKLAEDASATILDKAKNTRSKLAMLLEQHNVRSFRNSFIFDLGYGGSIQRALEQTFKSEFDAGLYFATFKSVKPLSYGRNNIYVYSVKDVDPRFAKIPFVQAVHIFETLFSHYEGTTLDYVSRSGSIYPVLSIEKDNERKVDFVGELLSGVNKFIDERILAGLGQLPITWDRLLAPFNVLAKTPHPVDLAMFENCSFENDFSGEPSAPIISRTGNAWWKFGQAIFKKHDANKIANSVFKGIGEDVMINTYVDYVEDVVVRKFRKEIADLKAQLSEQSKLLGLDYDNSTEMDISGKRIPVLPEEAPNWFNENTYLQINADVAESVAAGNFSSGYTHYKAFGYREGRRFN